MLSSDKLQDIGNCDGTSCKIASLFMEKTARSSSRNMQSHQISDKDAFSGPLKKEIEKRRHQSHRRHRQQAECSGLGLVNNLIRIVDKLCSSVAVALIIILLLNLRLAQARLMDLDDGLIQSSAESAPEADLSLAMSLRQVLGPSSSANGHLFQRHQLEQDPTYSPNNRGSGYSALRNAYRFGERTNPIDTIRISRRTSATDRHRHDKQTIAHGGPTIWSQPDPRQSFSLQLDVLDGVNRYHELKALPTAPTKSGQQVGAVKRAPGWSRLKNANIGGKSLKRISELETNRQTNLLLNTTPNLFDVSSDLASTNWRWSSQESRPVDASLTATSLLSSGSSRRKSAVPLHQAQPNMVALIRYVPVLLSVPTQQQLVLPVHQQAATSRGIHAQGRPTSGPELASAHSEGAEFPYYNLYRAPGERPVRYQIEPGTVAAELQRPTGQQQVGEPQLATAASSGLWAVPGNQQSAGSMALQTTDLLFESEYPARAAAAYLQPAASSNGLQGAIALIQPSEFGAAMSLTGIPAAGAARLAYLPLSAGQTPAAGTVSKAALSSYASKLISMLRPSALLSSIAQPSPSTSSSGSQYSFANQPASNQQIYLLAPAEGFSSNRHAAAKVNYPSAMAGGNQPRPVALLKADDLLLNQASTKLHSSSSAKGAALQGGHSSGWLHEWPNGLICVHELVQTGSKSAVDGQAKSIQIQPAPLLLSPLIVADQQPQASSTSVPDTADNGSFDYVPTLVSPTTDSSNLDTKRDIPKAPIKTAHNQQHEKQQFVKQSPAKLAKRLKSVAPLLPAQASTSSTPASNYNIDDSQQTLQDEAPQFDSDYTQKQPPAGFHQLKLTSSSSESRSISDNNSSSLLSRQADRGDRTKVDGSLQSSRLAALNKLDEASKQPIIPFTIKDKMDLSNRRGTSSSSRSQNQNSFHSNDPVQYDEQVEGETETPSKQVNGKQQSNWFDERRAKTSFVASTARYATVRPNEASQEARRQKANKNSLDEIDYLKEVGLGGRDTVTGYTLPLLMASSAVKRKTGANNDKISDWHRDENGSRSRRPVGVTSGPPPPLQSATTVSELGASGSSPVTTSSTLSGQPVTLSSGRLDFNLAGPSSREGQQGADESRLILVGWSSLTGYSSAKDKSINRTSPIEEAKPNKLHKAKGNKPETAMKPATIASKSTSPLELVVNSSRVEQQPAASDVRFGQPASTEPANDGFDQASIATTPKADSSLQSGETSTELTTTQDTVTQKAYNDEQPRANHSPESATSSGLFSNDRSLSMGAGSSPAEFGKISESLQTNPIDLIDLQNSRSSFALPAQLESWSMFAPHQHQQRQHQHQHQRSPGRLQQ